MFDLVLWSFLIVFAPLAVGLAWKQAVAVVLGLASVVRGPSGRPGEAGCVPSRP